MRHWLLSASFSVLLLFACKNMSFIPNTTPTPNWLYNGEMKKMSDVELRVVLLVTRYTLGWIADETTGMRRQEDWISHIMLMRKTGKSSRAISYAIAGCVKHGWIETRDKEGKLLQTPEERRRRRVFYRLGNIFTDKLKSTANSAVDSNLPQMTTRSTANDDTNLPQPLRNIKETLIKETLRKRDASLSKELLRAEKDPEVMSFAEYRKLASPPQQKAATPPIVREFIAHLKKKRDIATLDGMGNEKHGAEFLGKFREQLVKWKLPTDDTTVLRHYDGFLDKVLSDQFHSQNLTSMRYLNNNFNKLIILTS